jgi:hypothetical protein
MAYDIFSTEYFIMRTTPIAATICCTLVKVKHRHRSISMYSFKGDPAASGSFSGVFFGSGAGVEWVKEEDE